MVKPDAVQRGLISEIVGRFERKGLKLIGMKFMQPTEAIVESHYAEHKGKPFYPGLVKFLTSGPVVAMVWEGHNAIVQCRNIMGVTRPHEATPGSIRGDYAVDVGFNCVHGSDGPESAAREISIWFKPEELVDWKRLSDPYVFE